jgi:hypothetical protein
MKFIHRRFTEGAEGLCFSPILLEVGPMGIKKMPSKKKSAFLQKTGLMFFIDLQDHESPDEKGRSSLCPGESKVAIFGFRRIRLLRRFSGNMQFSPNLHKLISSLLCPFCLSSRNLKKDCHACVAILGPPDGGKGPVHFFH